MHDKNRNAVVEACTGKIGLGIRRVFLEEGYASQQGQMRHAC